jgi:hypothetical protein
MIDRVVKTFARLSRSHPSLSTNFLSPVHEIVEPGTGRGVAVLLVVKSSAMLFFEGFSRLHFL